MVHQYVTSLFDVYNFRPDVLSSLFSIRYYVPFGHSVFITFELLPYFHYLPLDFMSFRRFLLFDVPVFSVDLVPFDVLSVDVLLSAFLQYLDVLSDDQSETSLSLFYLPVYFFPHTVDHSVVL
jgi:hypothetical protein